MQVTTQSLVMKPCTAFVAILGIFARPNGLTALSTNIFVMCCASTAVQLFNDMLNYKPSGPLNKGRAKGKAFPKEKEDYRILHYKKEIAIITTPQILKMSSFAQ